MPSKHPSHFFLGLVRLQGLASQPPPAAALPVLTDLVYHS